MVPEHLVQVAEFPVNASGKIDRSALPAVDAAPADADADLQAPRTLVELALVDMYAGLLGRAEGGADQGFFDLGGTSLRAMQLVTRLRDDLAVDVGVADIFVAPAPRQLAAVLRDRHGVDDADLDEGGLDGLSDEETAAFLAGLD
jgi:enterobactin synthetase component F